MEKQKNKVLIVLVIVLLFVILGLGGYIVYDKVLNKNQIENNNSNTQNYNGNSGNKNNSNLALKIDSTKDWVYNANYNLPTNEDSYYGFSDHSKLIKASDLIVPYININSSDAKTANQEIYKLYELLINKFNENLKEKIWFTTVEYSSNINNDIISIMIKTTSAGTYTPLYEYYTYNFDVTNGNILSYQDAYKLVNINDSTIENVVEQKIKNELKDYPQSSYEEALNGSIDNYKKSVNDKSIKYYFDSTGKLNVIVTLYPIASGDSKKIIVLG